MEWDDLRLVLAIAREGTLSRAARRVGLSQPTLGRRLRALEARLDARLFDRTPEAHTLTPAGRAILGHVERMELDALAVERLVRGRDAGVRGRVRVTASEWVAAHWIAPSLATLAQQHPALEVELAESARHVVLTRREADVAVRPRPFDEDDVIQKRLGPVRFGLFAARTYLDRVGAPDFATAAAGHALIAMSDEVGDPTRAWQDRHLRGARVVARAHGREALRAIARSGAGLVCLPLALGEGLVALDVPVPLPAPHLHVGAHRDQRAVPRVRVVVEHLQRVLSLATRRPSGASRRADAP